MRITSLLIKYLQLHLKNLLFARTLTHFFIGPQPPSRIADYPQLFVYHGKIFWTTYWCSNFPIVEIIQPSFECLSKINVKALKLTRNKVKFQLHLMQVQLLQYAPIIVLIKLFVEFAIFGLSINHINNSWNIHFL